MKGYSVGKVNFIACASMAFFGVSMLSLGAILPPLRNLVPEAITLPPIMSVGIILGTIFFGPVMDRFGYKWLLVISCILLLAGLLGLAYSEEIRVLRGSIFLLGAGAGVINGETNAIVSDIYDDTKRGTKLSVLGACYCIGALLWTLSCVIIPNYKIPLIAAAVIMGILIIFSVCTKFPDAKLKPSDKEAKKGFFASFGLLKYGALVLVAVVLFFQSALEGTSGNYTTTYLTGFPGGLSATLATLSLTFFTIGMMLGRFALGPMMKRYKEIQVLNLYMMIGVIGALLLSFLPESVAAVIIAMFFMGFGVGATYPVMLNYLGRLFRRQSGAAFSIVLFIALCGQFLGNFAVGKMFTQQALFSNVFRFFPIVLGFFILVIIAVAPYAAKKCECKEEENKRKGIKL